MGFKKPLASLPVVNVVDGPTDRFFCLFRGRGAQAVSCLARGNLGHTATCVVAWVRILCGRLGRERVHGPALFTTRNWQSIYQPVG